MDAESKNIEIACPECGKDVCVLHDTKRSWTHRSRVIPRIVWAVVCLGLIGYWISTGQVYSVKNQTQAQAYQVPAMPAGKVSTNLNPIGRADLEIEYVSSQDFRDAIDGDEQAISVVRKKITEASVATKESKTWGSVESVQFGWKEPFGSFTSNKMYRFGGMLYSTHHSIKLHDIRDPNSVGHKQYRWSWGENDWSIFPRLGKRSVTQNGAIIDSWNIQYVNIFRLVSICIVCGWLVGILGRRLHIPVIKKRYTSMVLAVALILVGVIYAGTNPGVQEQTSGSFARDIAQSNVYTIEQLDEAVSDDVKLIELSRELIGVIPEWETQELLLSQAWNYAKTNVADGTVKKWAKPTTDIFSVSLSHSSQLIGYTKISYPDIKADEQVRASWKPSFWEGIREHGVVAIQWGPLENQRMISIGVLTFISIGVLFWLIWKINHWCARFVLGRVQKRRVIGNQCIFCAYPLTQEATQARYPQVAS